MLLIIPNYWEKHSIIFRTSNTIFFLFLLHLFPPLSYFIFSLRVSFRRSTSVMSLWMTTSSTLLDGGIISQRGSRPAGILIYGYCMTDVPTSKTDEHWLTKHSHSSHWIFHSLFSTENCYVFAILYDHLLVFCICYIFIFECLSSGKISRCNHFYMIYYWRCLFN